ncbi:DoxX family protein [Nocardioides limicola]|uniref:DoxX family protein n=1 Tax=Nocardioides limicola TaxID=2803368 RepID=UPI00193C6B3B|nr:DoxX family protein [Nocardioides sp. DJM-14]
MYALPDPVWPVLVLAVIQLGDGVLCAKPAGFISRCLTDVRLPRQWWWVLPPIKFGAATGLVLGLWLPWLALGTTIALIVYFLLAITAHVRARDFGRMLFVNATGMLVLTVGTLVVSFTPVLS